MFHMPTLSEWLVIGLILFVLFGANRLPEAGKALGEGIKNFRKALAGEEEEAKEIKGKEVKEGETPNP